MGLLICLRLLDYITYTIFYGTLTLFLIQQKALPGSEALLISAGFIGLNYGCSILGGTLLEWLNDLRIPLGLGVLFHFLGALLFFQFGQVFLGLSLFTLGSLTFDSSFFLALTRLYQAQLARLQKAFYLNYLGMNVGGLIGFTLGGFMQHSHSTDLIVIAVISVLILSLVTLVLSWQFLAKLKELAPHTRFTFIYQWGLYPLLLVAAFILILVLLVFQACVSTLVVSLWILIYVGVWIFLLAKKAVKKHPGYVHFMFLIMAYILFWSIYFLIPTLMALFLSNNVELSFYQLQFSPAWFINIMCVVVIIGVWHTMRVFKTKALQIERHFSWGFALQMLALLMLIIGISLAQTHKVALFWAIAYFIIQALAELSLAPIAYSSVGQLIEKPFQPFFMGFWLATLGAAVMIASKISQHIVMQLQSDPTDNLLYLNLFVILALVSVGGLILMALKHYFLKKYFPIPPLQ